MEDKIPSQQSVLEMSSELLEASTKHPNDLILEEEKDESAMSLSKFYQERSWLGFRIPNQENFINENMEQELI